MASPAAAEQQAARNAAIVALAARDLAPLWPQVDWDSSDALDAVKTIYRAVVTRYGAAAASAAAVFYDELRAERELSTSFTATIAAGLPDAVLDRTVESAFRGVEVTELDATTSDLPLDQRVQTRLEQKVQKHVLQPGRDTIVENTTADPAKPQGWARVTTSARPCAFCVMLASRTFRQHKRDPGLYSSTEAATRVVGRRGVARGVAELGSKYHSHCSCIAVPVFDEPPPGQQDAREMYEKAAANAGTAADTKKVLAAMRQLYDVK